MVCSFYTSMGVCGTGPRTEGIVGVWVPDIRRESKTRGRRSRRTGGGDGRTRWSRCTGEARQEEQDQDRVRQ